MAFESAEDVALQLPRFIDSCNERRLHSALGYLSPTRFEEERSRTPVETATRNCPTPGARSITTTRLRRALRIRRIRPVVATWNVAGDTTLGSDLHEDT